MKNHIKSETYGVIMSAEVITTKKDNKELGIVKAYFLPEPSDGYEKGTGEMTFFVAPEVVEKLIVGVPCRLLINISKNFNDFPAVTIVGSIGLKNGD